MTRSATSNTTSGFRQIGCRRVCLRLPIYVKSWVFLSHKSPYKAANFSKRLLRISLVGKNGNINYRIDYQGFQCKLKAREKKSYRAEKSKNQLNQSGRVGDYWVRHSRVIDSSEVFGQIFEESKQLKIENLFQKVKTSDKGEVTIDSELSIKHLNFHSFSRLRT